MSMLIAPARFDGGGGSHLWVRLYITAADTSTDAVSAAEIQFRATVGGSNLAVGGSSFASTNFDGSHSSSQAFDNDTASLWSSKAVSPPHWIAYKLSAPAIINEVTVQARADGGTYGQGFKDFVIQSSDDSTNGGDGTWTDEWSVTGQTGWTASQVRTFDRP